MATHWKYISLSQLMSSVKSDLSLYDDSALIDEDRVIKIIAECNEKLGQKIYKKRECKIIVKDNRAEIPSDLYKINTLLGSRVVNIINTSPNFNVRQLEFTSHKPKDTTKIITYGKMACTDSCDNCYWVTNNTPNQTDNYSVVEKFVPLDCVGNNKFNYNCSCNGNYKVDIEDNQFKFNFQNGEIYLDYLGDLISDSGEIEIPFHPMLNQYYEYAIKEKILEDMFLNSEADVLNKLQYVSQKKSSAFATAWNFVQTGEVREWNKIQRKLKQEHWNKWYKIYEQ